MMKCKYAVLAILFIVSYVSSCIAQTELFIHENTTWSEFSQQNGFGNCLPDTVLLIIGGEAKLTIEEGDSVNFKGIVRVLNGSLDVLGTINISGEIEITPLSNGIQAQCAILFSGSMTNNGKIYLSEGGELVIDSDGMSTNKGRIASEGKLAVLAGSTLNCEGTFDQGLPTSGFDGLCLINATGSLENSGTIRMDNAPLTQYGSTKLMMGSKLILEKSGNVLIWSGIFTSDPGSVVEFHDSSGLANLTGSIDFRGEQKWLGLLNYLYLGGINNALILPIQFPSSLDVTVENGAVLEIGN